MWGVASSAFSSSAGSRCGSCSQTSSAQPRPLRSRASPSTTSPREEFMRMAPGFIRPNSRLSAMWRVEASSGVWKVRMSASRATSSSVRNPHRSRSSRGGSQQTTRNPHPSAYAFTSDPTCPTPTIPSVRSAGCQPCVRERWTSVAPTHCSTPWALQPAAVVTSMPCAAHHAVSMWSKPMVAVAISFTRESASSFSSHRVRVRITSASASRTSAAEIAVPGRYSTSANGSRTPRRKGMALSAMIFMVTGVFFVFRL